MTSAGTYNANFCNFEQRKFFKGHVFTNKNAQTPKYFSKLTIQKKFFYKIKCDKQVKQHKHQIEKILNKILFFMMPHASIKQKIVFFLKIFVRFLAAKHS